MSENNLREKLLEKLWSGYRLNQDYGGQPQMSILSIYTCDHYQINFYEDENDLIIVRVNLMGTYPPIETFRTPKDLSDLENTPVHYMLKPQKYVFVMHNFSVSDSTDSKKTVNKLGYKVFKPADWDWEVQYFQGHMKEIHKGKDSFLFHSEDPNEHYSVGLNEYKSTECNKHELETLLKFLGVEFEGKTVVENSFIPPRYFVDAYWKKLT